MVVSYEYEETQENGTTQTVTGVAEKTGYNLFYQLELEDGTFGEKLPLSEEVKFVNAGVIRISVEANEEGSYKTPTSLYVDFEISAFALTVDNVGEVESVEFTGEGLTPEPVVTFNGKVLKKDVDYTLAYENNINVSSEAIVKVIGMGRYKGVAFKNFTITPKNIGFADIIIKNNELIYNGTNQSLTGDNIGLELDDITLVYGVDFEF